jgi:hypothetical protein
MTRKRELRDRGDRAVLSLEARLQRPLGDAVPNLVRRARAGSVRLDWGRHSTEMVS